MSHVRWAVTISLVTTFAGVVCAFVPFMADLEKSVGLPWLFVARGTTRPPDQVVLVSLDEESATRTGLPPLIRDWPRSAYATLVERLVERGAAAIAFDVQFFRHRDPDGDREFAAAIARSRRTVLIQRLEIVRPAGSDFLERQDPIPLLADAALGLAPVPMPDVAVVSWVWSFLDVPIAGEMPTLPAVMLQAKAMPVTSDFLEIAVEAGVEGLEGIPRSAGDIHRSSDLLRLMQTLRRQIQGRPSAVSNILERIRIAERTQPPERARLLRALADLYSGQSIRHLNFYGPPGTVCTIPYHIALGAESDSRCAIEGAIVFVGLASASVGRAGQPDTYHTAYPSSGGIELSGVEIQATALANLLTGTALRPAGAFLLIAVLTGVGVTLGSTAYWVRTRRRAAKGAARCRWKAATVVVALTIAYCGVAHLVFRSYYEVLPVVVPVLVQLPVALVLGLLAPPVRHRQQVHAVCLATDAGGSTAVGQRLPHSEYAQLMEDYRQLLVKAVVAHGGDPIPPEGDGLVCVWSGPPASGGVRGIDPVLRLRACQAALEIAESTERFNQEHMPDRRLPTRIGLAMGVVTIRSDADRGVFEIVGDTVNIAARLRDLNRDLGSRVLASADVIEGLEARLSWRPIPDTFTLKGVGRQPTVVEVTGALRIAGRDAATSRDTPTAPEPM